MRPLQTVGLGVALAGCHRSPGATAVAPRASAPESAEPAPSPPVPQPGPVTIVGHGGCPTAEGCIDVIREAVLAAHKPVDAFDEGVANLRSMFVADAPIDVLVLADDLTAQVVVGMTPQDPESILSKLPGTLTQDRLQASDGSWAAVQMHGRVWFSSNALGLDMLARAPTPASRPAKDAPVFGLTLDTGDLSEAVFDSFLGALAGLGGRKPSLTALQQSTFRSFRQMSLALRPGAKAHRYGIDATFSPKPNSSFANLLGRLGSESSRLGALVGPTSASHVHLALQWSGAAAGQRQKALTDLRKLFTSESPDDKAFAELVLATVDGLFDQTSLGEAIFSLDSIDGRPLVFAAVRELPGIVPLLEAGFKRIPAPPADSRLYKASFAKTRHGVEFELSATLPPEALAMIGLPWTDPTLLISTRGTTVLLAVGDRAAARQRIDGAQRVLRRPRPQPAKILSGTFDVFRSLDLFGKADLRWSALRTLMPADTFVVNLDSHATASEATLSMDADLRLLGAAAGL